MRKTPVALLLAFALVIAIAPSIAVSDVWQEVETWDDTLQMPSWQTVETWDDLFKVISTVGPPFLISPENNGIIYDNTPTFQWVAGEDATNHRFLLDNEDTFSTPLENVLLGPSATTYTVATPLADDNYWWKVIATAAGFENSSSVWKFELKTLVDKEWQTVETWGDLLYVVTLPYAGSGTVDDPYIIENIQELQGVQYNKSAYYALGCDIDASSTVSWNGGAGFVPIGTSVNRFVGSFDGRGYQITDLYINRSWANYVGLFGVVGNGGVVENVGLENENIIGRDYSGGLIGRNYGDVSNCYSTGSENVRYDSGGLIGWNNGNVDNCYSTGSVNSLGDSVGGLVGRNEGTISNSHSTSSVTTRTWIGSYTGGLVGQNYNNGSISDSYSTGAVTGRSLAGGLVGANDNGTISNCYSTSNVVANETGAISAGGLVGRNTDTISNCYSTGSVDGDGNVGGLVGRADAGIISNSYSTGLVTGNSYVGGLIGRYVAGTISNSFWDNQTSGQSSSAGGTGKTTENMKDNRTFTDVAWSDGLTSPWDFVDDPYDDVATADIWDIDGVTNDGYPFLVLYVLGWLDVETWDDFLEVEEVEEPPPPPSDEMVWAMFVLRCLMMLGPFGFIAWKFTKIRDPTTGAEAAVWIGVGFFAFVILWFVADAIQAVLYAI